MFRRSSAVEFTECEIHLQRAAVGSNSGHCEQDLQKMIRIRQARRLLSPAVYRGSVVPFDKDFFPNLETSRNERLSIACHRKPGNQQQKPWSRSIKSPSRGNGGVWSAQASVKESEPIRIGKIGLLRSACPRKNIKISRQPTLVLGHQFRNER